MKISELMDYLGDVLQDKGDLTVYIRTDYWDNYLTQPAPFCAEGGSEVHPYPGLYLN